MTHDQLIYRAVRWLLGSQRCWPVLCLNGGGMGGECPDAIGWTSNGDSILVECKVSIGDWYGDRRKAWRQPGAKGLGRFRYYLTAPGLLAGRTMPTGWGWLACYPKQMRRLVLPMRVTDGDWNGRRECHLLAGNVASCWPVYHWPELWPAKRKPEMPE